MTREQVEAVKLVYTRFIESEEIRWSSLDDQLEWFDYLKDSEMITESTIRYEVHSKGTFRCSQNHKQEHCMAPIILDAVKAILDLYKATKELHIKNRYILSFYLSMSELKMIYLA